MVSKSKTNKSFGYYFLNKRLHPPIPKNFRNSIIILIVNKNPTKNKDKFLLVKQSNNSWSIPKEGVKSNLMIEDLYTTISSNLENELGFKGIKVVESKPLFTQIALIFDFDKQVYDAERSLVEEKKGRPTKGKFYQLAIMEYRGPDEIPLIKNDYPEVIDYNWVNEREGLDLIRSNLNLVERKLLPSMASAEFGLYTFKKSLKIYNSLINSVFSKKEEQESLI